MRRFTLYVVAAMVVLLLAGIPASAAGVFLGIGGRHGSVIIGGGDPYYPYGAYAPAPYYYPYGYYDTYPGYYYGGGWGRGWRDRDDWRGHGDRDRHHEGGHRHR